MRKAKSHDVSEYKITKEEISLKELDFKLRKQLIEQHNLYGNIGSGTIVIKMKNGGKYTFELHKNYKNIAWQMLLMVQILIELK